jgi:elongation factor 1 alpha-like protein
MLGDKKGGSSEPPSSPPPQRIWACITWSLFSGQWILVLITCLYTTMLCSTGSVLCNPEKPIQVSASLEARVIVFDVEIPITLGFPVRILVLRIKDVRDGISVKKIVSQWLYWLTAC